MAPHAGFAAVICIRQSMMQDIVRILYNANQIEHQLRGGGLGVTFDFFLDAPEIVFSRANTDSYVINLNAWGPMTVTLPGRDPETCDVILTARVLAPHDITLQNAALTFRIDGMGSTLDSKEIIVFSGGPYSPEVWAFINGPEFHAMMEGVIRLHLSGIDQVIPPINVSFLGSIADTPNTRNTARALDGAVAIGLDITSGSITTNGNPDQLSDLTEGIIVPAGFGLKQLDMGYLTNRNVWIPLMTDDVRSDIEASLEGTDITLNRFDMELHEGHIHVSGKATKSPGSATFSMDAFPRLGRGGYSYQTGTDMFGQPYYVHVPYRDEVWLEIMNEEVDIKLPWWATFLHVLAGVIIFGIGAIIVGSIITSIRNKAVAQVSSYDGFIVGERTHEFTLPGDTNNITIRSCIDKFECHTYGTFFGLTYTPSFPRFRIRGSTCAPIERFARGDTPLRYGVQLPFNVHPADPQVRIRWTVRRRDNNEIILSSDELMQTNLEIPPSLVPAMSDATELAIECRVYRALGSHITDLGDARLWLTLWDRLDRSHPYVRWSHFADVPDVRVEDDGTHTVLGHHPKRRMSRIHRTDIPGRCIMVKHYSIFPPRSPREDFRAKWDQFTNHASEDGSRLSDEESKELTRIWGLIELYESSTFLEYLDELPFPRSELIRNRDRVCDYCFFGGPTKYVPLPLPS